MSTTNEFSCPSSTTNHLPKLNKSAGNISPWTSSFLTLPTKHTNIHKIPFTCVGVAYGQRNSLISCSRPRRRSRDCSGSWSPARGSWFEIQQQIYGSKVGLGVSRSDCRSHRYRSSQAWSPSLLLANECDIRLCTFSGELKLWDVALCREATSYSR